MKKIFEKIKLFFKNDIVKRALKTFIQAFLAVLVVVNIQNIKDIDSVKTILISGISAGISALWNFIVLLINEYLKK